MRAADTILIGHGAFVGWHGTISVRRVIKGKRLATAHAYLMDTCSRSLSSDAQKKLAQSKEEMTGTFYLQRKSGSPSSFRVTMFIPSQKNRD